MTHKKIIEVEIVEKKQKCTFLFLAVFIVMKSVEKRIRNCFCCKERKMTYRTVPIRMEVAYNCSGERVMENSALFYEITKIAEKKMVQKGRFCESCVDEKGKTEILTAKIILGS